MLLFTLCVRAKTSATVNDVCPTRPHAKDLQRKKMMYLPQGTVDAVSTCQSRASTVIVLQTAPPPYASGAFAIKLKTFTPRCPSNSATKLGH